MQGGLSEAAAPPLDAGIVVHGGRPLAIPAERMREIIPAPERLEPPLCAHPAAIGTIPLRGEMIPVIDLGRLEGLPQGAEGAFRAIGILRSGGRLLGIGLEGVSGLLRIPADDIVALHRGGDAAPVLSGAFVRDGATIAILDPDRLFAEPGLTSAEERPRTLTRSLATDEGQLLGLEAGGLRLAVDSRLVTVTFSADRLRPADVPVPGWPDTADYLGQEFPVFDDLSVLGLPGRAQSTGPVLALKMGSGLVGWRVDRLLGVIPPDRHAVQRLAGLPGEGGYGLFRAVLSHADWGQMLVVDAAAMEASAELGQMAELSRRRVEAADAERARRQSLGYLVFRSAARYGAIRLDQIRGVKRLGAMTFRAPVAGGVFGIATDAQGSEVVAMPFDQPPPDALDSRLIVLPRAERPGLCVDALCLLSYARTTQAQERLVPAFLDETVDGERRSIAIVGLD